MEICCQLICRYNTNWVQIKWQVFSGKYYMLEGLEKYCVEFVGVNMNAINVLTILDRCLKYEISLPLLESCQNYIRNRTGYLLNHWESLNVSYDCLIFLLEQDTLNVLEVDLFEFVGIDLFTTLFYFLYIWKHKFYHIHWIFLEPKLWSLRYLTGQKKLA